MNSFGAGRKRLKIFDKVILFEGSESKGKHNQEYNDNSFPLMTLMSFSTKQASSFFYYFITRSSSVRFLSGNLRITNERVMKRKQNFKQTTKLLRNQDSKTRMSWMEKEDRNRQKEKKKRSRTKRIRENS